MPPRKEPKEIVVYPASKRKPPPFKPQRPSKAPRISPVESSSGGRSQMIARSTASRAIIPNNTTQHSTKIRNRGSKDTAVRQQNIEEDDGDDRASLSSSSSSSLPLNLRQSAKPPAREASKPRVERPRIPSVSSSSEDPDADSQPQNLSAPAPKLSQSDSVPTVPQALLVRLLHEHFADKSTKIDRHAFQVLQKYVEIFVREAIARSSLRKQEDLSTASGVDAIDQMDASWLEIDDLEKVAATMMLDF